MALVEESPNKDLIVVDTDEPLQDTTPAAENSQSKTGLKQMALTQEQLTKVKDDLAKVIDTMAHNPSFFTRLAIFWGELPLWQKILLGLALAVPTLIAGVVAQIWLLLVITAFSLVAYIVCCVVLEDHYAHNVSVSDRLKEGVFSLADVLGTVIQALDLISKKLADEIAKFQVENEKLMENVDELGKKIIELSTQIDLLAETEKSLRATNDSLETISKDLRNSVDENSKLLKQYQEQLQQTKIDYERQISELNDVKVKMGVEVEQLKVVASTLNGAVNTLSSTVIKDEAQQKEFKDKLDVFLNDKKASFDKVADRIFKAERKLADAEIKMKENNDRYKESNEKYDKLLEKQAQQIELLKSINNSNITSQKSNVETLNNIGLFPNKGINNNQPTNHNSSTNTINNSP